MSAMQMSPFAGLSTEQLSNINCTVVSPSTGANVDWPLWYIETAAQARLINSIHAGARIGAAVVLGVLLLLLARTYRSIMFCLYETNFLILIVGSALELGWIFSFQSSVVELLTGGDIPQSSLNVSVAAGFFSMLLTLTLLATLVMQIYVACSDLRPIWHISIVAVSALACFPTCLIWIWRFVNTCIEELGSNKGLNVVAPESQDWIYDGAWPAYAASTGFCALVLCIKLWIVQRSRAKIGIQKFDPIRVLFTMAAQNTVIPCILAIIGGSMGPDNYGGQSITAAAIPLTAVLLPAGYIVAQYNMLRGTAYQQQQQQALPRIQVAEKKSQYSEPLSADSPYSEHMSYKDRV